MVLTQSLWESEYDSDPDIIGESIRFSGIPYEVVAIAPRQLEAMNAEAVTFFPYSWSEQEASGEQHFKFTSILYGRLQAGVSKEEVTAQLNTIEDQFIENDSKRVARMAQREAAGHTIEMGFVRAEQTRGAASGLLMLQIAAALLLLLGCANVVNLALARANSRHTEFSIRLSLGAKPGSIIRQLYLEGFLLSFVATVVGVFLTHASLKMINTVTSAHLITAMPVSLNSSTMLLAGGIALLVPALACLIPGIQLFKIAETMSERSTSRVASFSARHRLVAVFLVTVQFMLAVVVLVGAFLLFRSFIEVMRVDPGFDPSRIVYARTSKNLTYTSEEWTVTRQRILEEYRAIPGVESVSYSSSHPVDDRVKLVFFPIRGREKDASENWPQSHTFGVSPSYFETMGIPIIEGRAFEESDSLPGALIAYIVDETFARNQFPDGSAVGQQFDFGRRGANIPESRWPTIVGVARSVLTKGLDDQSSLPLVYTLVQATDTDMSIEVRTSLAPDACLRMMRDAMSRIDPSLPIYNAGTVQSLFDRALATRTGLMTLITIFGFLGLILSAVGVYGMLSYDVSQRIKEIGIREAIGATRNQIVALIVKQGLFKASLGLGLGVVISYFLNRYIESFLFKIDSANPVSYLAITALLFVVALIASWLPARRAASVDPCIALRTD